MNKEALPMMIAVAKHPALNLPNSVYVGRTKSVGKQYPSALHQLANPFVIGKDGTREEVVNKYKGWLFQRIKMGTSPIRFALLTLLDKASSSTGVVLVCHCTNELEGNECHAQVIAKALGWMMQEHKKTGFYPTCRSYWDAKEAQ